MSTGSSVSAADPIQATVTAPAGGTYTLTKITNPSSRAHFGFFSGTFAGPQFKLTWSVPPGCQLNAGCSGDAAINAFQQQSSQKLQVSFLIDRSIMPRSGNVTSKFPYRWAAAWICWTNLGGVPATPQSTCDSGSMGGSPSATGHDLADGNALVTEPIDNSVLTLAGGDSVTLDIGHNRWQVTQWKTSHNDLKSGVRVDIQCLLACTQHLTVSVSKAVARKLRLHSTEVGQRVVGPATSFAHVYVPLSAAFKKALGHHSATITVHAVVTGDEGERWSQSWELTI